MPKKWADLRAKMVPADRAKAELIAVLATMPDEAFGWFVLWAGGSMMQYPDGLGGFRPESQASIKRLRAASAAYQAATAAAE